MDDMHFAQTLARVRTDIGISQSFLARRIDMDHSYINRLEKGNRKPSREAVEKIIGGLHLDYGDPQALELMDAAGFRLVGTYPRYESYQIEEVNKSFAVADYETQKDVNIALKLLVDLMKLRQALLKS